MLHRLPSFNSLWTNYPNGEAAEVKSLIGGAINLAWVTNTCVIRLCYALNRCGFHIHDGMGMHTARGGDGYRYGYRVSEFKTFMENNFGPASKFTGGGQGIICFDVSVWSDATGHFDLWDGTQCKHQGYFDVANSVHLWHCP
jgi:hypothetical protein